MHKVKQLQRGVAVAAAVCAVAMAAPLAATHASSSQGPTLLTGWRYRVIGGIN